MVRGRLVDEIGEQKISNHYRPLYTMLRSLTFFFVVKAEKCV